MPRKAKASPSKANCTTVLPKGYKGRGQTNFASPRFELLRRARGARPSGWCRWVSHLSTLLYPRYNQLMFRSLADGCSRWLHRRPTSSSRPCPQLDPTACSRPSSQTQHRPYQSRSSMDRLPRHRWPGEHLDRGFRPHLTFGL